jgi:hypothetical protein
MDICYNPGIPLPRWESMGPRNANKASGRAYFSLNAAEEVSDSYQLPSLAVLEG